MDLLRVRYCRHCKSQFFLCRSCDHGQRYCSSTCRIQARRRQWRASSRRHQQSKLGRHNHADRQRSYAKHQKMTQQGISTVGTQIAVNFNAPPVGMSPQAL
ncbi:MAG: hypothetical protein JW841_10685 [Deltaproteobacteria bacterium]|nr:hypothetical protein [Deltaproteobacteria bacterium]